ncbi:class I SAM-dependent methyltransferase [Pandoraea oxalativorans]|uniref:Methyltransferase domain-containing protein n=1 Tax=Pandoraea oxalativorans TaxID=573737 RepID=A0A0E3YE47_9BURK|nr:class I SAM-dependent methyltransferase [Pandoraea oxalativorans]AKC71697.1 hypothetical protein MB84_22965 [Pandoraea oxalativorans]
MTHADAPDFDALYRASEDPWSVHSSWYEQRKRDLVLASLGRPRYAAALELGCGLGQITAPLASRCDRVHAVDLSPSAIERCRARLAARGIDNVSLDAMSVPEAWPLAERASVDLVIVSELAYYLPPERFTHLMQACLRSLDTGGEWVMCHYMPAFDDRVQPTHVLHEAVQRLSGLVRCVAHEDQRFRLDVWRKEREGRP